MRRVLGLMALVGLGVLIGFLIRLVLPRQERVTLAAYDAAAAGVQVR